LCVFCLHAIQRNVIASTSSFLQTLKPPAPKNKDKDFYTFKSESCCFLALDVMPMPQAEKHAGKQVDLTTRRSGARPHNGKQTCKRVLFFVTVTRNACRRSGCFRFGYRQPPRPKSRVRVVSS
jgi:hypothetical protein